MARNDKQLNIRIPYELIEELKTSAKQSKRSLTAQLNLIIEEWLKDQPKLIK
ncbi:Arc family DNA-binding protein [Acinetobacter dispersus]|uniref:Arc family DNA-binding protein n=1 Tax=Acinetobacter dispersus TaxID=70348 RepID=UPI003C2C4E60